MSLAIIDVSLLVGAFGRFCELCAWVAACCLIKKERFALGGFSLAAAMLLRVFPGALMLGPAVVLAFDFFAKRRCDRRLVSILAGAAIAIAVLVPFGLLRFPLYSLLVLKALLYFLVSWYAFAASAGKHSSDA